MEWVKSQRYQAAVDGHYAALCHWSSPRRQRGNKASGAGILSFAFSAVRLLGDVHTGCALLLNAPNGASFLLL